MSTLPDHSMSQAVFLMTIDAHQCTNEKKCFLKKYERIVRGITHYARDYHPTRGENPCCENS